ncbi:MULTISPECIES: hypothetical protein [Fusobacterium]|jgi:hypothetical protein|uniref:hypothetical protein n=1 Tax=Fusobacterium TaxID=848 RepID=UPI0022DF6069|nr:MULTISPECIES: hypothetical protein [Fusobacterium]
MATLTISTSDLQKMLNTENSDVVLLTKREYKELLEKIKIADEILKGRDDFDHYNAETIEAIEECERILKDSTVKGYNSIEELKEALEND